MTFLVGNRVINTLGEKGTVVASPLSLTETMLSVATPVVYDADNLVWYTPTENLTLLPEGM